MFKKRHRKNCSAGRHKRVFSQETLAQLDQDVVLYKPTTVFKEWHCKHCDKEGFSEHIITWLDFESSFKRIARRALCRV